MVRDRAADLAVRLGQVDAAVLEAQAVDHVAALRGADALGGHQALAVLKEGHIRLSGGRVRTGGGGTRCGDARRSRSTRGPHTVRPPRATTPPPRIRPGSPLGW